jgi:hypothetical protein
MTAGGADTFMEASNLRDPDGNLLDGGFGSRVQFVVGVSGLGVGRDQFDNASNGVATARFSTRSVGNYTVSIKGDGFEIAPCPTASFTVIEGSCEDQCSAVTDLFSSGAAGQPDFELCEQVTTADKQECLSCVNTPGVWTAIGCIPTEPQGIIQTIIQLGLGIGGGVTLLLILAGAFRLSVSQGDPKQAEEAREQITSAVIGLLFIIFSVAMLRFIGVSFLQIPGFGS